MFSSTPSRMLQVCFMCRAPCGERSLGEGPGDVKGGDLPKGPGPEEASVGSQGSESHRTQQLLLLCSSYEC